MERNHSKMLASMTSKMLISIPENFIVLFHHSYRDEGLEIVIAKCKECNLFHYMFHSFEFTHHVTQEARDEETFEALVNRIYIETKNVIDQANWCSYQEFKRIYHVS